MHDKVVRAMIIRLFPAGQRHIVNNHYSADWKGRWLRERRVAHENILRLYLERVVGEGLRAFTDAEQAWTYMSDGQALDGYLRSLDAERLQDVIASLEAYEDQFAPQHVVPATIVLLNLLPGIPKRKRIEEMRSRKYSRIRRSNLVRLMQLHRHYFLNRYKQL